MAHIEPLLQKKETIIVKSELDTNGIEAPAVTLQTTHNNLGWKSVGGKSDDWQNFELYEHCKRINMTIDQCIHNDSIRLTDFLASAKIEKIFDLDSAAPPLLLNLSASSAYWREDMTWTAPGKYFIFKAPKSIALKQDYCMTFVLVKNFTFFVFVHDEDFLILAVNPLGPPVG